MEFEGFEAVRVTIQDGQQVVSLLAGRDTALRLVAGCSVNPQSLEELLLATEVYERGIAAWLMGDLMTFDKAWQRQGQAYVERAFDPDGSPENQPSAFQVVDELTEEAAHAPAEGGLIAIDLTAHHIGVAGDVEVLREDQVLVHASGRLTERAITYILPKSWEIDSLP